MTIQSDRKLEIFVGATRRDLGAARQTIINAILATGHIPSGMELWAAGTKPPLKVIARYLNRCDAHIMLVGTRYGSPIDSGDSISFTEWEYQESKEKRPILPFILDEESLKGADADEADGEDEETRRKLRRLREELLKTKYVKKFTNDEKGLQELEKQAIIAINDLLQSNDVPANAGWIRGDSIEAQTARDITSNPFLKRELDQLRRFSTLGARVWLDVASKRAAAKSFWENMQGRIRRHKYFNLFFESGTSIAYLSDEFVNLALAHGQDAQDWHIHTNNVLSLVYFDLHTSIDASRFPTGTPEPDDEYGAIFPGEWKQLHEPAPKLPRELYPKEKEAVDAMRRAFRKVSGRQLVLATASGLDLDNDERNFRGPHVGSHPNMLFKRAIFTSGNPVVLFLSAEKLGDSFRCRGQKPPYKGNCYSVFDPSDPWEKAATKYPMAICVGYEYPKKSRTASRILPEDVERRNNIDYIRERLHGLGFSVVYFEETAPSNTLKELGTGAVLYANEKFAQLLPDD